MIVGISSRKEAFAHRFFLVAPRSKATTAATILLACLLIGLSLFVSESAAQVISSNHSNNLTLSNIGSTVGYSSGVPSRITQIAFGPGPDPGKTYLYSSSSSEGVRRMEYNPTIGALSDRVDVDTTSGNGIAFHGSDIYLSQGYTSLVSGRSVSRLKRLTDGDGNGIYNDGGTSGDTKINIARGIPRFDHGLNQIDFVGDTLYVGNGTRTHNGAFAAGTPSDNFGESAYGGAILMIEDVTLVPSEPSVS